MESVYSSSNKFSGPPCAIRFSSYRLAEVDPSEGGNARNVSVDRRWSVRLSDSGSSDLLGSRPAYLLDIFGYGGGEVLVKIDCKLR